MTHIVKGARTPLQAERTHLTVEQGHKHYNTHSHELFWEHLHDTKCLMAWGDDAVVLAFRGTASMANAKADLQVGHKVLGRSHGELLAGADGALSIRRDETVLAFRGAAWMANANADLQVGHKVLGRLPGELLAGADGVLPIRGRCPQWPMPRPTCRCARQTPWAGCLLWASLLAPHHDAVLLGDCFKPRADLQMG